MNKNLIMALFSTIIITLSGCSKDKPQTIPQHELGDTSYFSQQLIALNAHNTAPLTSKKYPYATYVRQASEKYNINESLIFAVIKTESSFRSKAVSHAGALGLMQVVPNSAGVDVFSLVKNRSGKPNRAYLFHPQRNIDTGTAYLHLLNTRFLVNIDNPISRFYLMISAYNGGASRALGVFDSDKEEAIDIINDLPPKDVLAMLVLQHPAKESRDYLKKVLKHQVDFYQIT